MRPLSWFLTALFLSLASMAQNAPKKSEDKLTENSQAQKAITFFQKLDKSSLQLVDDFYDTATEFQDPIHKLKGNESIKAYYAALYANVEKIQFQFTRVVSEKNTHVLFWTMHLKTPSLNGGNEYSVDGNSVITFSENDKAIYHRDYFDMGDFVYERVPVLKNIIAYIKTRMGGK